MANDQLTEIIFILDKSGSMGAIRQSTINGFNQFVSEQSALPGEVKFSLILFDSTCFMTYSGASPKEVSDLNSKTYVPDGNTALLDAVGSAIDKTGKRLARIDESQRPGKVVVVIMTDGEENSSKEYTAEEIKSRVKLQQEKYAWEFLFLGANQDAWLEAEKLGMEKAYNFDATESGVEMVYSQVCDMVSAVRSRGGKRGG